MLELLTRRPVTAEFCCQVDVPLYHADCFVLDSRGLFKSVSNNASRVFSAFAYWILRALALALPFCLVSLRSGSPNHRTTLSLGRDSGVLRCCQNSGWVLLSRVRRLSSGFASGFWQK